MTATVVLGPVPCKKCRQSVHFDGQRWCDSDGLSHSCRFAAKIARRYWATGKTLGVRWSR